MTALKSTGFTLAASLAVAIGAVPTWAEPPSVQCSVIEDGVAPRIDGHLDDRAWQEAVWTGGFRQSVPTYGQAATEQTEVAFLLDSHAIYVGVRCHDSEPDLVRANKLRHRDEPKTDDHVEVIFDTYRDQVRGALFIVNPLGAKEEGLVNGLYRTTWSWDEVWTVKTTATADGWQAEFRIPLRVLRYASDAAQTWGVNVRRVVRRKQEDTYLNPPQPPYDITALRDEALLTGLRLGRRQRNLQVIPYALAGRIREDDDGTGRSDTRAVEDAGLDLKYSLTTGLTLDATTNTDFAQVESDEVQVNLTRYSLFYPEKREFFLENAQLFSFGHREGNPEHAPDLAPFFSRRIGLSEGRTVPIQVGARLTGKVGRDDIGVLSVRTGPVRELGLASAWYNVARVRHDLGGRSYIGGIVTDSRRDGFRSTTAGLDGEWYLTPDLSLRADLLRVDSDGEKRDAYDVSLDLTTDPWGFLFAYGEVEDGFSPDLGFVRRDGSRRKQALLRRSWRTGRWGVRRITLRTNNSWVDSLVHHTSESAEYVLMCEIELENGDIIRVERGRSFERLFEPFRLDDQLTFAPGAYSFDVTELHYRSDESRRWGIDADATVGEFYDGDRSEVGGSAWLVLNRHLRAAASYTLYDISTDHGEIDWNLWSARLEYIHSAYLSASSFLQYNSSNGTTLLNLRLRWILPNDSNLFLVYNDRDEELGDGVTRRSREVALKIAYRFFL